jgi:hypothetical protein
VGTQRVGALALAGFSVGIPVGTWTVLTDVIVASIRPLQPTLRLRPCISSTIPVSSVGPPAADSPNRFILSFISFWWVGWDWVYSVRRSLFVLWWIMMRVEQSVKWLAGETEVPGENLSQCHFIHHKSLTCARTRAAAVGSQRLTAWASAWLHIPSWSVNLCSYRTQKTGVHSHAPNMWSLLPSSLRATNYSLCGHHMLKVSRESLPTQEP